MLSKLFFDQPKAEWTNAYLPTFPTNFHQLPPALYMIHYLYAAVVGQYGTAAWVGTIDNQIVVHLLLR